jgi:hypothetical protein
MPPFSRASETKPRRFSNVGRFAAHDRNIWLVSLPTIIAAPANPQDPASIGEFDGSG